jgi:riboflavin transporter FmnP
MDTKQITFIAILSALGTVLSAISLGVVPIIPNVALDLSHVATFVAAIFGGPALGGAVGFLGGIYAGYYFGFSTPNGLGLLSLIGVPIGKAMTGILSGLLYRKLKLDSASGRSILAVPATLISYIPESIYTAFYFLFAVRLINVAPMAFMILVVIPKGWVEITVMSIMMGALAGNRGFIETINRFLNQQKTQKK